MIKKEDQRSRITKQMLENSFIDLLSSKPIGNISVKEVCEKSQINRSTFYSYYEDIYDLYNSIKDQITLVIQDALNKFDKNSNFYNEIFRYFKENEQVVKIFIGLQVDNEFIQSLLTMAEDKMFQIYKSKYILINEKKFRNYFTFVSNGTIGIINRWILEGMKEDYTEIAKMTEQISVKGIKYMY